MTLQSNQIWQRTFLMTYVLLSAVGLDAVTNIQGVPTWICLGLKSPFIEFGMQIEQLANNSIPLNITKDEQAYMHQEGLRKLGTFIKPVDLRDSTTGFVKADLTKRLQSPSAQARRLHPIQEEMDQKQIILLDEDTDENGLPTSLTDEDRKFIVPMALKNSSPEVRWSVPAKSTTVEPNRAAFTSGSWRQSANMHLSTTTPPEPTSNIDDLKKHILFLHNMTKSDNNFESKFVKFPSLQKEKDKQAASLGPVKKPQRPVLQYAAPIAPPTRTVPFGAHTPGQKPFGGYYLHEDDTNGPSSFLQSNSGSVGAVERMKEESVTNIISRVHLLSDETSTTTSSIAWENTLSTTETSTKRTTKRPVCLRNPDSPKCVKQRQREEQQRQRERDEWFRGQSEFLRPRFEPFIQTINNTKRFAVSIEIPDSFKVYPGSPLLNEDHEQKRLSRVMRSQDLSKDKSESELDSNNYFAQGIIMTSAGVANNREFMLANVHNFSSDRNNETALNPPAYSEIINLDPDNCYKVNGFALGQKKLCALYTSVMPAISRGARAAIQECQFQFKTRRWNCSTIDDETVFGPMTSLGSPEMAFIHALAAATVTSFVARACRDGQLTSCGCSRGSRPKQLHDDWTWGGCGDNLEYAYKFSTDFIDVREKETRRRTRGVRMPELQSFEQKQQKHKLINIDNARSSRETNINLSTHGGIQQSVTEAQAENKVNPLMLSTQPSLVSLPKQGSGSENKKNLGLYINPDDLLQLQERISKEILNSKLQEKEMIELQDKINREILSSNLFNGDSTAKRRKHKRKNSRAVTVSKDVPVLSSANLKARSLMNLHNNEAGRRAVIKKTRITCKCHGVSGSCSLITCWQQLSSIREIGDYLREKYEEATEVKLNKRGRLQVKNSQFKIPTAHDLIYLDESPDWCRTNRLLQWSGTHGRVCNKTSSGLDGCGILCCGRGYNTKNIVVRERCNCKFHWCCQVKCEACTKILEEHTCK